MPSQQRGFTLLELLIAMTLGLLLLGGILTVYIASSHSYRVAENTSRMQEGARFAFEKIGENVRMTGHMGCFGNIGDLRNIALPALSFTAATVLSGLDSSASTDEITIRKASAASLPLNNSMADVDSAIPVLANTMGLKENDYLLISNCGAADLICGASAKFSFTATPALGAACTPSATCSPCTGNSSTNLAKAYSADAEIMRLEETRFYIANNPAGQPALYWQKRTGSDTVTEEIVEGVQDMQVCYGEDTSGNSAANLYRTAGTVGNWANVVSVRVSLLMRSTENGVAANAQPYAIDRNCDGDTADTGESVNTPTDRHLRRVFTSTFGIRNRLP